MAEVTQEVQPFSLLGSPEVVMPIRTRERNLWPIQGNEFVQDPGTLETYIRVYQAFGKAIHFAVEVKRQALAWHILAHRYQLHGQRDGQAIERHWSFRVAPVRDSEGKDLSQVCGSVLEKVAYQATLLSFGSVEDAYEEDIGTPPDLRHVAPPVERSPLGWLEWQTRTIEQLAERTPARLRASVP